jgi:hypothetical protein
MYSPDGQNEGGNIPEDNNDKKNENSKSSDVKEEDKEKPFFEKVHDALQDWSNDDQRDQEFDDTRP